MSHQALGPENNHVVFVLEDFEGPFSLRHPNVNCGVGDLTGVTTRRACPERMIVIYVEFSVDVHDQIWFVIWENRSSAVERLDVKSTSLCTLRCDSNLEGIIRIIPQTESALEKETPGGMRVGTESKARKCVGSKR